MFLTLFGIWENLKIWKDVLGDNAILIHSFRWMANCNDAVFYIQSIRNKIKNKYFILPLLPPLDFEDLDTEREFEREPDLED